MSSRARYTLVMLSLGALLVAGLALTLLDRVGDSSNGNPATTAVADSTSLTATAQETMHAGPTATTDPIVLPTDSAALTSTAPTVVPELTVGQPTMVSPTDGLARVRDYYSEAYTIDIFTVRWRPGAFPPDRADEVAAAARQALDHDNALLGTQDNEPLEIFLADALFNDECFGCQGFAASDLRQVFILQDGSVAPDELPILLAHEIGHVLAGNYIALPHENLMFAEGWAVWVSEQGMQDAGYITALQTAAWAQRAGRLPTLDELRVAGYEGRVRARDEYDGAASFTAFLIDTYGLDIYKQLYSKQPPEEVLGKDWATLEGEWHAYLAQWQDAQVNGVSADQWWQVADSLIAGYARLYEDPTTVTPEQYAALASARVALNRADLPRATALAAASGLTVGAAN